MSTNRYGQRQPHTEREPPGTCLFDPPVSEDPIEAQRLKRHPKKHHLILVPQPSDSPRDPLNWSWWRKELLFIAVTWISCLTGVIGPILVPAFGDVSVELNEPIPKIAQLNGVLVLLEGIGGVLVVMMSIVCGRRLCYIVFITLQLVSCIWAAVSKSYGSLYGARAIQGFGMAASAVLSGTTITDTFFTYEHGYRVAVWQAGYLASIQLAPVISGIIATDYGWRTTFWVMTAFEVAGLILVLVGMPETFFERSPQSHVSPTSLPANDEDQAQLEKLEIETVENAKNPQTRRERGSGHTGSSDLGPMTWRDQLRIPIRPTEPDISFKTVIIRPLLLIISPNIIYACLAYTIAFNWFVASGATYSQIYAGQYYQKSVQVVGYIAGWPPLIGAVLAAIASGPISDHGARWLSMRNHGIFEPEFRLILLVPAAICTTIGGFGWGWSLGPEYPIITSEVFAAFLFAGAVLGCCGAVGYANACFPRRGGEGFGVIMLLRSCFIFGSTYYYNDFLALQGSKAFFGTFAGATLGIFLLAIPVFLWGKVWRSWIAENPKTRWLVL